MTALAADANREKRGLGRVFHIPVAATTKIFKGAIVSINATGFAVPGADAVGGQVIGVAMEAKDNALGADGDLVVRVQAEAEWLFTATSITRAMVGDTMMIVDDNTVDDAAGPTNDVIVGRLTEYLSATSGWVYVPGLTTLV